MLEDISEVARGHRNVPDEQLEATWAELDANSSGDVDFGEFLAFMRTYGLTLRYA